MTWWLCAKVPITHMAISLCWISKNVKVRVPLGESTVDILRQQENSEPHCTWVWKVRIRCRFLRKQSHPAITGDEYLSYMAMFSSTDVTGPVSMTPLLYMAGGSRPWYSFEKMFRL